MKDLRALAKKIHDESMVVDAHLDVGLIIYEKKKKGNIDRVLETIFYDDFKKASVNIIIAAIYLESEFIPEKSLQMALKQINMIYDDVEKSSDKFIIVKDNKDIDEAIESGRIGILISLEGAEPINNDLDMLGIFYKLGVRGFGLTWSRRNYVADGSCFGEPEMGIIGGLTPFGVRAVAKAIELGMFLDVSHLNDAGFADVVRFTKKPFIASHSNARQLNNITRNITDEQIKSIADRGGVIGINGYKSIVSSDKEEAGISEYCDHIEYMVNLVGEDYVGIGLDLCNSIDGFYDEKGKYIIDEVIESHGEMIDITEELLKRGNKEKTIGKIIGRNFRRYLSDVLS